MFRYVIHTTQDVCPRSNRLKVVYVDACPVATKVINLQSDRDCAPGSDVGVSVSQKGFAAKRERTIAIGEPRTYPKVASVSLNFYSGKEGRFEQSNNGLCS